MVMHHLSKRAANHRVAKMGGRLEHFTRTVNDCHTPKCRARHVTSSPAPMRPEVTPATARSPVFDVEFVWRSMLRAKSNTRPIGASISVVSSMIAMQLGLREPDPPYQRSALSREPRKEAPPILRVAGRGSTAAPR